MKCSNSRVGFGFVSSYTLTSQLLTIPILSRSTSNCESKPDSGSNLFQLFKRYIIFKI